MGRDLNPDGTECEQRARYIPDANVGSGSAALKWEPAGFQQGWSAAVAAGVALWLPRAIVSKTVAESLIAPGDFEQAYGSLADDAIVAFTHTGEVHWFGVRQR